jgi:drug/metabolite transporter (DMT)-like permease
MFRGSIIIFGGVLSMIFLKKRLVLRQWAGMGIVFLGLAAVGVSSLLGDDKSSFDTKLIIGIVLILAGQLSNAIQMVVEETFLKKHDYPPLHVVGMEGLNGSIIMAFIVLPVCYFIPAYDNANAGSYSESISELKSLLWAWLCRLVRELP